MLNYPNKDFKYKGHYDSYDILWYIIVKEIVH